MLEPRTRKGTPFCWFFLWIFVPDLILTGRMQAMFHTLSEFGFRFCRLKQRDSAACLLQGRLSARICSPANVLRFRKNAGGATARGARSRDRRRTPEVHVKK